jgi:hypothetical protein
MESKTKFLYGANEHLWNPKPTSFHPNPRPAPEKPLSTSSTPTGIIINKYRYIAVCGAQRTAMLGELLSADQLKYKSHGVKPNTRVYLASTSVGLALTESEYGAFSEPKKMAIAHSWSNDRPCVCILWLVLPTTVMQLNGAEDWCCPAMETARRRLTFHPVSVLSWDWLKAYVNLTLDCHLSRTTLSEKACLDLSSKAQRGYGKHSLQLTVKLPTPIGGQTPSSAPSPYQELLKTLAALNSDSQRDEID